MHVYYSLEEFKINKPVVGIGIFDGVHVGHRYLFDRMKEIGVNSGGETVILTFWPHPRLVLNHQTEKLKYLSTLKGKQELLEACGIDHMIILPFSEEIRNMSAWEFVENILVGSLHIHTLVMGFNHVFGKDRKGNYEKMREYAEKAGFDVVRVEAMKVDGKEVSSTLIREVLWSGDVCHAEKLLGYPYFIFGRIVGGKRIGRSLGFPTANICPDDEHKLIPGDGVYAVQVFLSGRSFGGMLNIGIRPTVNHGVPDKTIEVHIFDFHGDIYGQDVTVTFVDRIRDEKKFEGVEELARQLEKDKQIAMKLLRDKK
ncbi:MAG TPA: bifunctional riboflavin kinase/FAD synthetase [Bacteroidetes bacterium]|nr:bifunctional riboflavin kinase/FAD synthetase [Bacteroidota bacterium]